MMNYHAEYVADDVLRAKRVQKVLFFFIYAICDEHWPSEVNLRGVL
jgi:hypothetical protein